MGYLHEGMSLIRRASSGCDRVDIAVRFHPLQFRPGD